MPAKQVAMPPLSGFETEYPFGALDKDGRSIPFKRAYDGIEEHARRAAPHLPGVHRNGIFLGNGSFFYRDAANGGAHLELATGEVTNPRDAVRMIEAGHCILKRFLNGWKAENSFVKEARFFRHSFDYLGNQSWATHMSIMTSTSRERIEAGLLPHLVSKVVLGGSGGFKPQTDGNIEFCLSPRLYTFSRLDGGDTQGERALIGEKGSNHCSEGFSRLHLIGFESLCCHLGRYLDAGATMLIMKMMDAGVDPASELQLRDPLCILRTFAMDPSCRQQVSVGRGRKLTATQIQRVYLEVTCAYLGASWMPVWAGEFCGLWRDTLERIELGAPESVADRLDWALKYTLFKAHADRHAAGSWSACRAQLMELDMRYGQFGGDDSSIFEQLEASGLVSHRIPGVDDASIQRAVEEPPQDTRAKARCEGIRQVREALHQGRATWASVFDQTNRTWMDLSNPFSMDAPWQDNPQSSRQAVSPFSTTPEPQTLSSESVSYALNEALSLYDVGQFFRAWEILDGMAGCFMSNSDKVRHLSIAAWTLARLGMADQAREYIQVLERLDDPFSMNHVLDQLAVCRFLHLLPPHSVEYWIARGEIILATRQIGALVEKDYYHLAAGNLLCRLGRPGEGIIQLEAVINGGALSTMPLRFRARALADCGEALRLLGDAPLASRRLAEAEAIQRQNRFAAELADFTLASRAKMETDPAVARACLTEAMVIQTECGTPVSRARSLLLDARLAGPGDGGRRQREFLLKLMENTPVLAQDDTLRRIFLNWGSWIGGGPDPDGIRSDPFWGL